MALEVRELIIKTAVGTQSNKGGNSIGNDSGYDKQAIIKECIEQVLEILKDKANR